MHVVVLYFIMVFFRVVAPKKERKKISNKTSSFLFLKKGLRALALACLCGTSGEESITLRYMSLCFDCWSSGGIRTKSQSKQVNIHVSAIFSSSFAFFFVIVYDR